MRFFEGPKVEHGRHLMVDGGLRRDKQDTGKSAADFVDWKFFKDYGGKEIVLDAIVVSHCDNDHFTQLVGDRAAIAAALAEDADPAFSGEWAELMQAALGARWTDDEPTPIQRISDADGYLPGFETETKGSPSIRVLGPLQGNVNGQPGVRRYGAKDSINTDGNSVVLRLDYGSCRMLLTGDLNRPSQEALLDRHTKEQDAFRCDVGKACHHGSKEISLAFLKAMEPAVTVFSSGDDEDYDHPRPTTMAASAINGYLEKDGDELKSPLLLTAQGSPTYFPSQHRRHSPDAPQGHPPYGPMRWRRRS